MLLTTYYGFTIPQIAAMVVGLIVVIFIYVMIRDKINRNKAKSALFTVDNGNILFLETVGVRVTQIAALAGQRHDIQAFCVKSKRIIPVWKDEKTGKSAEGVTAYAAA